MTTQAPMTVEKVFDGYDFRSEHREETEHFFPGHLAAGQIESIYFGLYPEHRAAWPYTVDASSIRHAWHVFTAHEDTCWLITDNDPEDPYTDDDYMLCTCHAAYNADDNTGSGYEYRHPHPATPDTPGAIPVTWVTIGPI